MKDERMRLCVWEEKKNKRSFDRLIYWLIVHYSTDHAYAICCKRKDEYYGLRPSRVYIKSTKKGEPQSKDNTESGIVRHKFYIEEI